MTQNVIEELRAAWEGGAMGLLTPEMRRLFDRLSAVKIDGADIPIRNIMERAYAGDGGCILHRGSKTSLGYPWVFFFQKNWRASRFILYALSGEMLRQDQFACHSCDNTGCINPEHLFIGSHKDNMRDASGKGRLSAKKSESHRAALSESKKRKFQSGEIKPHIPTRKLTDHQVLEIRASDDSVPNLAQRYGVCRQAIRNVLSGKTWKALTTQGTTP